MFPSPFISKGIFNLLNLFKMVTVSGYAVRQNQDGESFVVLLLQGDMELVQSRTSKHFYATSKKCSISSTFNEQTAATLVGKQLPGNIVKEECDPYEFVSPETGEVLELNFRWVYNTDKTHEDSQPVKADLKSFSRNGSLALA